MSKVVVIGLGQLGRVFAGGLLRTGHTVVPVNRGDDLFTVAHAHPDPALVLVAVAENDLHTVLAAMPGAWRLAAACCVDPERAAAARLGTIPLR